MERKEVMQQSSKHLRTRSAETSSLGSSRFEENSIKKIEGLQNCLNLQKSGSWKLHRDQAPVIFCFFFNPGVTGVQVSVTVKQQGTLWFQIFQPDWNGSSSWSSCELLADIISSLSFVIISWSVWLPGMQVTIPNTIPQTHLQKSSSYGIIFQDHFLVPAGFSQWFFE